VEARKDPGVAAACLLAALGREDLEGKEEVRAFVGAMLVADGLEELRRLRKILEKVFSK